MQRDELKSLLTGKIEGRRILGGIGATKFDEMIASGEIESVRIGRRRLIKISSLERLVGIEPDQFGEA